MKRVNAFTPEWRTQAIEAIQARHSGATVRMASMGAAMVKEEGGAERTFTATITTDQLDRDREVLVPDGMDPTEFRKSPTIFWNHMYDMPVGKALDINKSHSQWVSKAQIAARPKDFQGDFFPDFVWAMVSQNMISGVSVGFEPIEERKPTARDRKEHGDQIRNVVSKWKLLEWSIAPLQSNVGAVITAVSKGLVQRDAALSLFPGIELTGNPGTLVRPASWRTRVIDGNPKPVVKRKAPDVAKMVERAMKRKAGRLYE